METKPSSLIRLLRAKNTRRQIAHDLRDSGILLAVPSKLAFLLLALMVVFAQVFSAQTQPTQTPPAPPPAGAQTPSLPAARQTPSQPPQQAAPAASQPSAPPLPPQKTLAVVVLDPAHGGADQGARGASGIAESDIVLGYARLMRISLEGQGLRVLLTRQANDDPSFDDRSKLANSQRGGIFISLHVSSTGQPGTVNVYSMPQTGVSLPGASAPRPGLLSWDRAQFNFLGPSRRLAELIQIQMAQRFRGSPEVPLLAPVRQLRTIGVPAVAIEVSSVSVADRTRLDQMGFGLADGVARAVAAFRTIYESGGN